MVVVRSCSKEKAYCVSSLSSNLVSSMASLSWLAKCVFIKPSVSEEVYLQELLFSCSVLADAELEAEAAAVAVLCCVVQ